MDLGTIIGTIMGALITGLSLLLNSIFSSRSTKKREEYNRLTQEKINEIKELETLYEDILHFLDKLIKGLGKLSTPELDTFYKAHIKLELYSTKEINYKVTDLRNGIVEMKNNLPELPDEFIPKFEEDRDRRSRLARLEDTKKERRKKSENYIPNLYVQYKDISALMKEDLLHRKYLSLHEYLEYKKNKQ